MKKEEKLTLAFEDGDGRVLRACPLTAVPLQEKTVLELSVAFFSDAEPCMIHRSAVMSRMYMELLDYFLAGLARGQSRFAAGGMPERLASFIDVAGWAAVTARRGGCGN